MNFLNTRVVHLLCVSEIKQIAEEMCTLKLTSVHNPSVVNLKDVLPMTPQRAKAIERIVRSEKYMYKSKFTQLIMAGQSDFFRLYATEDLQTFLQLPAFSCLQDIILNKCGLENVPKFDHLSHLNVIDISDNELEYLPDFRHSNLKQLRIEGNPIPKVVINPSNLRKLELLSLGSAKTEIIGGLLLERAAQHELCLEVDPMFRDNLTVPLLTPMYTTTVNFGSSEAYTEGFASRPKALSTYSSSVISLPFQSLSHRDSKLASKSSRKTSIISAVSKQSTRLSGKFSFGKSSKKSETYLVSTRTLVEKTLDVLPYFTKVKQEMNYSSISNVEARYRAMLYVLEEVNKSVNQFKLNLTSQTDLIEWLKPEELDTFLKHQGLRKLQYLFLNRCSLPKIPNLTNLKQLTHLNLSENHIHQVGNNILELVKLKHLDLGNNPISDIGDALPSCQQLAFLDIANTNVKTLDLSFTGGKFSRLLQCGSEHLRYISNTTLQVIILKKLNIRIMQDHRGKLILPPYEILTNVKRLEEFLQTTRPTDLLQDIDISDNCLYYEALMHLLEQQNTRYDTIDLTGRDLGSERISSVVAHQNVKSLREIHLRKTKIQVLPDFKDLDSLKVLNLGENSINSLSSLQNNSVVTLIVDKNSFTILDFDPDQLKSLKKVIFGSEYCEFVAFPVLVRASNGEPILHLREDFMQKLLFPLPNVLENAQDLRECVKNTEITLRQFNISNPLKLSECINWLAREHPLTQEVLNLDDENDFCKSIGMEKLGEMILNVRTIKVLKLANCQLFSVPSTKSLACLEQVDLKNNQIKYTNLNTDFSASIVEIDLRDNPVEGFDLDQVSLPDLKSLKIGSSETKYISLSLLKRVADKSVAITISEDHAQYLVYPPGNLLISDAVNLSKFVDDANLDLTKIDENERKSVFMWVVKHSGHMLNSLKLSISDSENKHLSDDILAIFEREKKSLEQLKSLQMTNVGLSSLPDLSYFKNLADANFSNNCIEHVDDLSGSNSLEELDLSFNPIQYFDTNFSNFPSLKKLHIGSTTTNYLCYELLVRIGSKFHLICPEKDIQLLVYPPHDVVSNNDNLREFLEKKELCVEKCARKLMLLRLL